MQTQDKDKILADLNHGRETLITALIGVTEETAARTPAPAKWSILQCVEHLAIAEDYLFSQIRQSRTQIPMLNEQRERLIRTRGVDRSIPMQSPEVGVPTGRFPTLSVALQHFLESRQRTTRFVEDCQVDLRAELTSHPILGPVNCFETLLIISVHPLRHAQQIEEIKAQLGQSQPLQSNIAG